MFCSIGCFVSHFVHGIVFMRLSQKEKTLARNVPIVLIKRLESFVRNFLDNWCNATSMVCFLSFTKQSNGVSHSHNLCFQDVLVMCWLKFDRWLCARHTQLFCRRHTVDCLQSESLRWKVKKWKNKNDLSVTDQLKQSKKRNMQQRAHFDISL